MILEVFKKLSRSLNYKKEVLAIQLPRLFSSIWWRNWWGVKLHLYQIYNEVFCKDFFKITPVWMKQIIKLIQSKKRQQLVKTYKHYRSQRYSEALTPDDLFLFQYKMFAEKRIN